MISSASSHPSPASTSPRARSARRRSVPRYRSRRALIAQRCSCSRARRASPGLWRRRESLVSTRPGWRRSGWPDRAVGAKRADLKHPPRLDPREQVQELVLRWRDVDRAQPSLDRRPLSVVIRPPARYTNALRTMPARCWVCAAPASARPRKTRLVIVPGTGRLYGTLFPLRRIRVARKQRTDNSRPRFPCSSREASAASRPTLPLEHGSSLGPRVAV